MSIRRIFARPSRTVACALLAVDLCALAGLAAWALAGRRVSVPVLAAIAWFAASALFGLGYLCAPRGRRTSREKVPA